MLNLSLCLFSKKKLCNCNANIFIKKRFLHNGVEAIRPSMFSRFLQRITEIVKPKRVSYFQSEKSYFLKSLIKGKEKIAPNNEHENSDFMSLSTNSEMGYKPSIIDKLRTKIGFSFSKPQSSIGSKALYSTRIPGEKYYVADVQFTSVGVQYLQTQMSHNNKNAEILFETVRVGRQNLIIHKFIMSTNANNEPVIHGAVTKGKQVKYFDYNSNKFVSMPSSVIDSKKLLSGTYGKSQRMTTFAEISIPMHMLNNKMVHITKDTNLTKNIQSMTNDIDYVSQNYSYTHSW